MRGTIIACTLALVAMAPATARADVAGLAAARTAVESSDYLTAKSALATALVAGTASPDELVEIYKLTGIVAGALGDTKAATDAFTHMLALAPKAGLPPGTSPKIAKPFATASTYWKTHEPLAAKTETTPETATVPPAITVIATSDPLAMIARVRVTFVVDGKPEEAREGPTGAPIELPHGARIDLRVAVLDASGNRLVELGTREVPIVIVGTAPIATHDRAPPIVKPHAPHAPAPVGKRPLYARWWLYGGATVVSLGVASYFALEARSAANDLSAIEATSSMHQFSEARALEDRGHRDARDANIAFGVAGVFAIVTGVVFATHLEVKF